MKFVKLFYDNCTQLRICNSDIKITFFDTLDAAADFSVFKRKGGLALIALNAEKLVNLTSKKHVHDSLQNVILYPDGAPICWLNNNQTQRIPGVELWIEILKRLNQKKQNILIIGGSSKVIMCAEEKLKKKFRNLNFVCIDGYKAWEEYEDILKIHKPACTFIAMGSPKQEKLISKLQEQLPGTMYMGIGGSLDIFTNNVRRAPKFFRDNGLEFLYRLMQNPIRAKRQLIYFRFIYKYLRGSFAVENCRGNEI